MTNEEHAVLSNALGSIEIGGRTFLVAQPKRSDLFSFWQFCRTKAKSNKPALSDELSQLAGLPDDIRAVAVPLIINKHNPEPDASSVWEAMASPEGIAFLTFLLTRQHNKVDLAQLNSAITSENVDQVTTDLEDASGMRVITSGLRTDPVNPTKASDSSR